MDGGSVDATTALGSGTGVPSVDGVVDSMSRDTGAADAGIVDSVALEAATAPDGMTTGDASADASSE